MADLALSCERLVEVLQLRHAEGGLQVGHAVVPAELLVDEAPLRRVEAPRAAGQERAAPSMHASKNAESNPLDFRN